MRGRLLPHGEALQLRRLHFPTMLSQRHLRVAVPTIQCLGKLCRNLENLRRDIQSETKLSHLEALPQGQGH